MSYHSLYSRLCAHLGACSPNSSGFIIFLPQVSVYSFAYVYFSIPVTSERVSGRGRLRLNMCIRYTVDFFFFIKLLSVQNTQPSKNPSGEN